MADEGRVPVAIRIVRPYRTEDEFLSRELDSLTRTTVVLLGAQSKPQGVVLRFEITLATGDPLLRGEGRVVHYRMASETAEAGLTLRFTRLDARSKALVDRSALMREARAKSSFPAPPPPLVQAAPESKPLPAAPHEAPAPPPLAAQPAQPMAPTRRTPPPLPGGGAAPRAAASRAMRAPREREEALDRLRERARSLAPSVVAQILAKRPG